ncbi:MAG: aldolase/citrate lyase family protein [Planctomycetota bacterium]|nr:aldolase/citrate lyase family protein [Planctomycetota bacterium]MDA1138151.1 aldolase/citrate lyase family protein [Planctomycetota bacterium]
MRENKVKSILKKGKATIGSCISLPDPFAAEVMGQIGFDFLIIDLEHSPLTTSELQTIFIALRDSPSTKIVRTPWNDPVWVKRILDLGAEGIIFPWISSKAECQQAVASTKYPPAGNRGWGPRRAVRINGGAEEYFAKANDNILVFAQIENSSAVANLDGILSTPGLDGIMIGPADLSASYGHLMDRGHQEVQDAMNQILKKCQEHKVPFGLFSGTLELAQYWIERGGQIGTIGGDVGFMESAAVQAKKDADALSFNGR